MKRFLRRFGASLLLASAFILTSCSLTSDLSKMEDKDDYVAYIQKWAPSEDAFLAVQRLAKPALDAQDWDGAVAVFEQYRSTFPLMAGRFDKIISILREPSYNVELRNLHALNTEWNEIKPSVTVDGSRLYFASDRPGGFGNLDIYVSDYEDGEWLEPVNIGERINTKEHETINGISFDGTKILVYGGFAGHLGNGDNYYFEKTARGWSNIMHFPPLVNSKFYDSDAFMTADGFAVLFTSDREGVIGDRVPKNTPFHGGLNGNTDIFVSVRRGNYWQPPINLGPTINTPYAERSAFLHPDGKTLYFSSDGHPGLGKLDVFKSIRLREDSWTEWSTPVNLGKDVNTAEDDWGYKITPDGRYAFYAAANRPGSAGQNDLYMITLPRAARPESPVATLSGNILDDDGNPIGADIMVQRLSDGKVVGTGQSDPETGRFMLSVPEGDNYALFVEKEGYYPDAKNLDLGKGSLADGSDRNGDGRDGDGRNGDGRNGDGRDGDGRNGDGRNGDGRDGDGRNGDGRNGDGRDGSGRSFSFNFDLKSVESMRSKRDKWGDLLAQGLNNIFFDFNKWDLRPESYFEIDRLLRFLELHPDLRIVIAAHTDDIGTDEYNYDLSNKRARSVMDYLIRKNIDRSRLEFLGYGESRPAVPNDSEENRAKNRRVEFRLAETD
jgi:outer membrane protein OmpA-like peptidoglycan-associated protein